MAKEARDTRGQESGGKSGGDDGLEVAADKVSQMADSALAERFIFANQRVTSGESVEHMELFEEIEPTFTPQEHIPDPLLLEEIYNSLVNKEVHHKKLLEEGEQANFLVRFLRQFSRRLMSARVGQVSQSQIVPDHWIFMSLCGKSLRRSRATYMADFSAMVDMWLRNPVTTRTLFRWEVIIFSLVFLINSTLLVVFSRHLNLFPSSKWPTWRSSIFHMSLVSNILALTPPFFLMILWFVNVNYLHLSRNFHFFLFIFLSLALGLSLFSLANGLLFTFVDTLK